MPGTRGDIRPARPNRRSNGQGVGACDRQTLTRAAGHPALSTIRVCEEAAGHG